MLLLPGIAVCISLQAQKPKTGKLLNRSAKQVAFMLSQLDSAKANGSAPGLISPRTRENGKLKIVRGQDWTSGFFPGILWYLYQHTRDETWRKQANVYTMALKPIQYFGGTHDLGFIMYCSFGNGYRLTSDTSYRSVIIQSAKTLAGRYNPVAGVIKSWDFASESKWKYPVIIDNMMNLELLFEATRLTKDSSFYRIAISHADKTIVNHYRSDYSSFHVVDYDPSDGHVRQRITAQGYKDSSAWARGQAWGLYGFTMTYRETGIRKYLQQAEQVAEYILRRQPAGKIPFWDYDAPGIPDEPLDVSAACITASALYELYQHTRNKTYLHAGDKLLNAVVKSSLSPLYQNNGFVLLHSTGHKPANSEVDVPLVYADYYFIEALIRRENL